MKNSRAIIITGGPRSVYDKDAPQYDPRIFKMGVPVLGICYGAQLIAQEFGATVEMRALREDGQIEVDIDTTSALFK